MGLNRQLNELPRAENKVSQAQGQESVESPNQSLLTLPALRLSHFCSCMIPLHQRFSTNTGRNWLRLTPAAGWARLCMPQGLAAGSGFCS